MKIEGKIIQNDSKRGLDMELIQSHLQTRIAQILRDPLCAPSSEIEYRMELNDSWTSGDYHCKALMRIDHKEIWMLSSTGVTPASALSKAFDHLEDLICVAVTSTKENAENVRYINTAAA